MWAALPVAALTVTVGGIGARLATNYVDQGCPAGPTHEVGYGMMVIAVLVLTPATLVTGMIGLWRGPIAARIAAVVGAVLVLATVGYLYSLAYHWDIQCSVH